MGADINWGEFLTACISLYSLIGGRGIICPHLSRKRKPPPGPCLVRDTEIHIICSEFYILSQYWYCYLINILIIYLIDLLDELKFIQIENNLTRELSNLKLIWTIKHYIFCNQFLFLSRKKIIFFGFTQSSNSRTFHSISYAPLSMGLWLMNVTHLYWLVT